MKTAALALLLVLAACGGSKAEGPPAPPKTFALTGSAVLLGSCADAMTFGLGEGAQVVVTGPSDEKVAVGELGVEDDGGIACAFPFSIDDVPDTFDLYTVTVGDSSETYTRADLETDVTLSIS